MRGRRRPEITEDEVLAWNVWTLGYLLEKIGYLFEARTQITQPLEPGVYEMQIEHVEDFSMEMHPKIYMSFNLVRINDGTDTPAAKQGESAKEEHGEGAIPSERPDELVRSDTASERRSDLDAGTTEGPGGRTVREPSSDPRD